MPRQLFVEYPWAVCHVVSRGDRREDSINDDLDRGDFSWKSATTRLQRVASEPMVEDPVMIAFE